VEITFEEYVSGAQRAYEEAFGAEGLQKWMEDMHAAMKRIERRLGGLRYSVLTEIFGDACVQQYQSGTMEGFKAWILYLLEEYYDPMYDYQIEKNSNRVCFRGTFEEVETYLAGLV
jgi:tRNA 2-selenouridine synthase